MSDCWPTVGQLLGKSWAKVGVGVGQKLVLVLAVGIKVGVGVGIQAALSGKGCQRT